jgi:hypothetical protein
MKSLKRPNARARRRLEELKDTSKYFDPYLSPLSTCPRCLTGQIVTDREEWLCLQCAYRPT